MDIKSTLTLTFNVICQLPLVQIVFDNILNHININYILYIYYYYLTNMIIIIKNNTYILIQNQKIKYMYVYISEKISINSSKLVNFYNKASNQELQLPSHYTSKKVF